jgi:F-type H+-transporting ATPase subunit b
MDLNLSTLIFQIINFLVMVFILTRFFFKPVLRVLDERSKRVTSALDEAEKRERDAAEKQVAYEQRLTEAQEQVTVMQQQGQEELERARRRALSEARDEIQALRAKADREIREARQQAISRHYDELARLATDLGGQLMREAGGDAFQRSSVQEFSKRLSALSPDAYLHVLEGGDRDAVRVQLVSAYELDAESLSAIETRAQEMAGGPIEMTYTVDPALVAGATMRFGDVVIDGSVAGQLESLRERFAADRQGDQQ